MGRTPARAWLRGHWLFLALPAIVAFCAGSAILLARHGSDRAVIAFDDYSELIAPLLAAASCLVAARRGRGRHMVGWLLLGAWALAWGLGQAAWTFQEVVLGQKPGDLFPSWPDLGFLASVPLGLAGLLALPSSRARLRSLPRVLLDALLIASALLFVSWVLVLSAIYDNSPVGLEQRILSLAYPVSDIAMGTVLLVVISRLRSQHREPFFWLAAGLLLTTVSDTAFAYLTTVQNYATNPVNVGWTAGYLLVAVAALRTRATGREADDSSRAREHSSRALLLLPYLPVVASGILVLVRQIRETSGDPLLAWDGLSLVGLVLLRQFMALNENLALSRNLEARVQARTTELVEGRAQLHASESRFRSLVQHSSDVIAIVDAHGSILYVSASVENVLGFEAAELLGRTVGDLVHAEDRPGIDDMIAQSASLPQCVLSFEGRMRDHAGRWRQTETRLTSLLDDPSVAGIVLNTRDITDRKELEQELLHEAFHDRLTGLPNRALFHDRLAHEISRQRRREEATIAILILDLDGFKSVNDTLGHTVGDELLRQTADRLLLALRPGDTVARLGGDEFGILLEDLGEQAEAGRVAERLVACLDVPFAVTGRDLVVRACVGIAIPSAGTETADDLLSQADLALYKAKERGHGNHEFFHPAYHSDAAERLNLEADLSQALQNDELVVYYQPIMDLLTTRVVGVEALVRWIHPTRGVVPPLEFIPMAEQTGLIFDVGRFVLRTACADLRAWHDARPDQAGLTMSVNLSAKQLRDPLLLDDIRSTLREFKVGPGDLTLEVTESLLMDNIDEAIALLTSIRELGVRVALDDFGTGYSSFSYLRQIPLDTLKIDRSFVREIDVHPASAALVRSIVSLGEALGLEIVAEGIEGVEQLNEVRHLGCERGQGYHFAKPMPGGAILETIGRLNGAVRGLSA